MTKNILKTLQKKWSRWPQGRKAAFVASASSVVMLSIVAVISLHVHALDKGSVASCGADSTKEVCTSKSELVEPASAGDAVQGELIGPVLPSEVPPSEGAPSEDAQAQPVQETQTEHKGDATHTKPEHKAPAEHDHKHKASTKHISEHKAPAEHAREHKPAAPAPAQDAPKAPPHEVQAPSERKPEVVQTAPPNKRGHWETIVEKPAWDEPVYEEVPNYEWVGYAVFWADGYRSASMEETFRHMDELMAAGIDSAYRTESVKEPRPGTRREYVGMRHHYPVTRQVWVED